MEFSEDINEILIQNTLLDFQKKNLSLEQKSEVLKSLIKKYGVSQREIARRFNIPHSTVHDWVSMRQRERTKGYLVATIDKQNEFYSLLNRLDYVINNKKIIFDDRTKKLLSEVIYQLKELGG